MPPSQVKALSDKIDGLKELIEKFNIVYVKDEHGMIAGYDRAEFEMNLLNEIKSRPTLEDVNKLLKSEFDKMPRKTLSKAGKFIQDWATILNFLMMIGMIFFFIIYGVHQ